MRALLLSHRNDSFVFPGMNTPNQRIRFSQVAPDAYRAMLALEEYVRSTGIEPTILELVRLRASYLNGCARCVDMHTKDARAAGETEQRLYAVPVWRDTPFFTPPGRAHTRADVAEAPMIQSTGNQAPGFKEYPGPHIAVKPAGKRVQVKFRGEVIADTKEAVALEEGMGGSTVAPIVYYVPRKDVKMDRLQRTSHQTYCPFKGHASYYSLKGGPENAVWSYEQPYDEMVSIKELLAFYPDKVDSIAVVPG